MRKTSSSKVRTTRCGTLSTRSITDISLNLTYKNLVEDMKQVIEDSREIVRGVETKDGKRYLMRLRSYTDIDRVRTGLLLLFHRQQPEVFEKD